MKKYLVVLALLLCSLSFIFVPHASAQTNVQSYSGACVAYPSNYNCDGQYAYYQGCSYDQEWLYETTFSNWNTRAYIYLMWSPSCKTEWAETYIAPIYPFCGYTYTLRAPGYDGGYLYEFSPYRCYYGGAWVWTPMVFSPDNYSEACLHGTVYLEACTPWG